MAKFLLTRTVRFVAVLVTITVLTFFFLHEIPGNPVQILLGEHATRADIIRLTQQLGLDRPWYEQLVAYLGAATVFRVRTSSRRCSESVA